MINYAKEKGVYLSVLSDGKFHQTVTKETEGAVLREYETSNGQKGQKWELLASSVEGKITNLEIRDGDYGKQLQITMQSGDDTCTISLQTSSNFGEDFMKKLPSISPDEVIKVAPFAFTDDKGKQRRGITVYRQSGEKVVDHYHKKEGDKIVAVNGYPAIPADANGWDSDEWKLYFMNARKFLIEETKKHPLFNQKPVANFDDFKYPTPADEGIDPEKITF